MRILRLVIGVAILCLFFRTFVALGVVEPVTVIGKSMAMGLVEGDPLVVDRASLGWRALRRWQRVVARLPDDATRLGVKRVVGLPGERVEFRGGDLWIDGKLVRKTLAQQLALRQLVHRESPGDRRWRANLGKASWQGGALLLQSSAVDTPTLLRFSGGVLHDDLAINANVTRPLNPVADLMLCGVFVLSDAGNDRSKCEAIIARGGQTVRLELQPNRWRLSSDATNPPAVYAGSLAATEANPARRVVFSLFDQQATVAIDEQLVVSAPLPPSGPVSTPQQLALLATGGVSVRNLAVYRDVYYVRRPIDLAPTDPEGAWPLGPDRWFLVGDNQAVSLDSRCWRTDAAGVPERLILGRLAGE